jgi:hypothetical protein
MSAWSGIATGLRETAFRWAVSKRLRQVEIPRSSLPLDQARHLGLLFQADGEQALQRAISLMEQLQTRGVQVHSLAYVPRPKRYLPPPEQAQFGPAQVSWPGIPRGEAVQQFASGPCDILICGWTGTCLPLRYLALSSRAAWRIAEYSPSKEPCAELLVRLPEPAAGGNKAQHEAAALDELYRQFLHYLPTIKTHANPKTPV